MILNLLVAGISYWIARISADYFYKKGSTRSRTIIAGASIYICAGFVLGGLVGAAWFAIAISGVAGFLLIPDVFILNGFGLAGLSIARAVIYFAPLYLIWNGIRTNPAAIVVPKTHVATWGPVVLLCVTLMLFAFQIIIAAQGVNTAQQRASDVLNKANQERARVEQMMNSR